MPRGGERAGRPGGTYENRSDLQAGPRTARGPQAPVYGEGQVQQAVRQTPIVPPPELPGPGEIPSLTDPTERPGEPVTAGLSVGPGPGPESLGAVPVYDDALFDLRALAAQTGYKDFLRIIASAERNK